MDSYYRPGTRRGAAMLAVLQAILLLSALVLTPSATIAQDMDPAASDAPQAEQASEPTPEPAPAESQSGPTVEKKAARSSTDSKPEAQSGATSEAGPAESVADVRLRLFPRKQKLFPGGRKVVSAWTCPADVGASFGPDKEPGTKDDDCVAVRAKWSVGPDDAGRLSNVVGYKTRVTLLADSDLQIVAKADGLTGKGTILAKDEPAKVRPQAVDVEPSTVADEPIAEPVAEESAEPQTVPVAEEPARADRGSRRRRTRPLPGPHHRRTHRFRGSQQRRAGDRGTRRLRGSRHRRARRRGAAGADPRADQEAQVER